MPRAEVLTPFVSHSSEVSAFSSEKMDHLRCCFTAYRGIFIWWSRLNVQVLLHIISNNSPLWSQLYAEPCKCPSNNRYAANVYRSTGTHVENISCLSALMILRSNCSSPSCAKSGCIINGDTVQLVSAENKINDEERMPKQFRLFLCFSLLAVTVPSWQGPDLIHLPLINDPVSSLFSSSVLSKLSLK